MKSSENSFEKPKGCLSCSIRFENHFSPTGNKKKLFEKLRIVSHSAEKCKRTLWDLLTYILLQNIKNSKGDPFGTKKVSKKIAQCRKKSKGDPLASSGLVCYVKVKNERGTLCTKFALAGLGLSSFSSLF